MRLLPRLLVLTLLATPGCRPDAPLVQGSAEAIARESSMLMQQVSDRIDPQADPSAIVATVNGEAITVADLAAYLTLFPQMTVQDAVDDLVDLRIVVSLARAVPAIEDAARDGQARGRAMSWLMANVWSRLDDSVAEGSAAILNDPAYTTLFGTPELRRASHLLLQFGDTTTEEDKAWARQRLQTLHDELRSSDSLWYANLRAVQQAISDEATRHNTTAICDAHLVFPRTHSGPATWNGLDAVVEPFGAAAFAEGTRPGQLLGPVETQFGIHLILLEGVVPARLVDRERQQDLARRILRRNEFQRVFNEEVQRVAGRVQMVLDQDVINLLSRSAEDRMAFEQEVRSSRFE